MPVWLTIVLALGGSALITATVNLIFNLITNSTKKKVQNAKILAKELEARDENLRRAVQALLRHELYDIYNEYYPKGYAPIDVKNDFEFIYMGYHNLGKNGVMNGIHDRFITLPEESPKKKILNE